jgi:signal transduction histidine kinase
MCQGILLHWEPLRDLLAAEVAEFFPQAKLSPMREAVPAHPERTMTALPVELDPGPAAFTMPSPGWTPLRIGLSLAWAAALIALAAVGLGGWSLIDLSQRRIRFVSTVTHELRTPLTTLRLYLDMLTGGLVRDEKTKEEYLHTLNAETDRLNRLVGNVLDFSRLENQRPRLEMTSIAVSDLLEQVRAAWQNRCNESDKELLIENQAGENSRVTTDVSLVQQLLGNLIDNACKYSRAAADRRLWLRARTGQGGEFVLEVEDRGPGITRSERRSIFRPFCRGREADVTAGGVGLGLALAQRWARLLGGSLALYPGARTTGACFRLELPPG